MLRFIVSKINSVNILSSQWDALCSVGGKTENLDFILTKFRLRMDQTLQIGLTEIRQGKKTEKRRRDRE